ncbi:MAG: murein hydrolase activator EnvC family protein [Acidobacteriota bacterium]
MVASAVSASNGGGGTRRALENGGRLLLVTVLLVGVVTQGLAAQSADQQRAQALARRAAARIRTLQAEAEQLAKQERTLLIELRQLDVDRQLKAEEVKQLDAQLAATRADLGKTSAEAERLDREIQAGAPAVGSRLASLYKMGRPGYWRLLLDVGDLRSVGRAYRTVAAMARIDRDRIAEHQRKLALLRESRAVLQKRAAEVTRLQADATAARGALDRAIQARNARVAAIDRQRDLNAQYTGELQDAQRRLQASVSEMGSAETDDLALPIGPFRGDLPWPARGTVARKFGTERDERFGTAVIRNGLEIRAPEGNPVVAVHDGRVAFAGSFTGFGNLVIVDHGRGNFSLYGFLDELSVGKGDSVERQRQVGTVGRTPTGQPAVYFELRIDGRPVDPLQWLKR